MALLSQACLSVSTHIEENCIYKSFQGIIWCRNVDEKQIKRTYIKGNIDKVQPSYILSNIMYNNYRVFKKNFILWVLGYFVLCLIYPAPFHLIFSLSFFCRWKGAAKVMQPVQSNQKADWKFFLGHTVVFFLLVYG